MFLRMRILFIGIVFSQILIGSSFAIEEYLGLKDCIEIALKQNSDIIIAKEDQEIAKAKTNNAWSTIFPKLGISSGYNKVLSRQGSLSIEKSLDEGKIPTSSLGFLDGFGFGQEMDTYSLSLTMQQLLFGLHALPSLEAANYGLDLAKYNYISKKIDIIYKTKEAYFNILKADELLKSSKENLSLITKLIEKTEEMVSAGIATEIDLLRLKLQLKNIEQGVLFSQNNANTTRAQLNLILGKSVTSNLKLAPINKNPNSIYKDLDLEALSDFALKWRPELKVMDFQIKLYNTQIAIINSANAPNVFFNGSVGMVNYKPTFDYEKNKDWMVSVVGQWNFFDSGNTSSKAEETRATIRKIEEQKKALTRGIELELSVIINQINLSLSKIETAKVELDLAKENYNLTNEKFLANAATNLEVIDSQTSLLSSNINLITAQYDFEIAKARLEKILGIVNVSDEFMNIGVNNE